MSTGEMAKNLDVSAPTICKRFDTLKKNGLLKVSGVVDPNQHQDMIPALAAMNTQSKGLINKVVANL